MTLSDIRKQRLVPKYEQNLHYRTMAQHEIHQSPDLERDWVVIRVHTAMQFPFHLQIKVDCFTTEFFENLYAAIHTSSTMAFPKMH